MKNRRSLPVYALFRLGAGCALAACGSGAALAQDTSPPSEEALDEVVVTGFRASLEAALDIKREPIGSVDAIVAEDISKFPDLNLAEADPTRARSLDRSATRARAARSACAAWAPSSRACA